MPAGFTLTPGTPQQISLTVAATDTAAAATLVFNASAGTLAHTAELAVTITPPQPTFSLQVTPATLTLSPGGGAQAVSVSATPLYGFSGPINVVLSGLPAAVTASPSTLTLTPGVAQTVNVTAGSNAAAGTAFLNLLGTSGTISNSASVGLTINASTPDFVLSATPSSITVTPGTFQPVDAFDCPAERFQLRSYGNDRHLARRRCCQPTGWRRQYRDGATFSRSRKHSASRGECTPGCLCRSSRWPICAGHHRFPSRRRGSHPECDGNCESRRHHKRKFRLLPWFRTVRSAALSGRDRVRWLGGVARHRRDPLRQVGRRRRRSLLLAHFRPA